MQTVNDSSSGGVVSSLASLEDNSRWHVLVASWLGTMFDGMDASIFALVLFPALSEILKTNSHSAIGLTGSWVMAAFMVGWASGAIIFGILADYIGRTKVMMITILLYAGATGLCALSHTWQDLAFYRFLVGCGIGGEISCGVVLVAEIWRGSARIKALGILASSFSAGYLIAALLNLVLGPYGWRCLFLVGIAPAIITLYIRSKVKEPLSFQFTQEQKKRLRAKDKKLLTAKEADIIGFTFSQLFNKTNMLNTFRIMVIASVMIVGYWAVVAWIPPWINQLTGTAAIKERSLTVAFLNVGAILGNCLCGWFVSWLGRRKSFLLFFLGSFIVTSTMFLTVKSFGPALLAWAVAVGFFANSLFGFQYIYVPECFETKIRSTAMGFCTQMGRIMAAMAALVGGQLIVLFNGSYALAAAVLSTIYLVGFIGSFFLKETGEVSIFHANELEKERLTV